MNPAGIIIRYINWRKWKKWFFNVPLFIFQLLFLVVGKILGKVEVEWGEIWHAAQVSHVRLVLEPATTLDGVSEQYFWTMNFGYPEAEIQIWDTDWNDGKYLEYFDPADTPSPRFVQRMIRYAHDQVGKPVARKYDWLQLFGYAANLAIWLFRWPLWGEEVILWFNLPGGREDCISGIVACLWFGEATERTSEVAILQDKDTTYFKGYDRAVIPPCMVPLSKKWRKA